MPRSNVEVAELRNKSWKVLACERRCISGFLSAKNNLHFGGDKRQPGKRLRSQARKVFEQLRNVFGLFSVYSLVSDQFNIVE